MVGGKVEISTLQNGSRSASLNTTLSLLHPHHSYKKESIQFFIQKCNFEITNTSISLAVLLDTLTWSSYKAAVDFDEFHLSLLVKSRTVITVVSVWKGGVVKGL